MKNPTTTQSELLTTVRQGLLDFSRSCSVHSPLAAADFFQTAEGAAYYSSGIEYATCNGIIGGNDEDSIPTGAEIDRAIDYFSQRKLPFIWWTPAKNLESRGFQFGGILTGIAVDISEGVPQEMAASSNVKIKVVQSDADLQVFTQLSSTFGMSDNTLNQFHAVNSAVMIQGEQVNFLAYLDGIPVGGVTLSTCPSSAGVWSGVVLPEYRKQGIGTALVRAALVKAHESGYEQVMGILMPKGMAWGMVTRLGFKEVCQFPFYVYGTSDSLEKDEEIKGEVQTPEERA